MSQLKVVTSSQAGWPNPSMLLPPLSPNRSHLTHIIPTTVTSPANYLVVGGNAAPVLADPLTILLTVQSGELEPLLADSEPRPSRSRLAIFCFDQ